MFDKEILDKLWADLRGKFGNDSDWDQIVRDTHLGVARADAEVDLGDIDARVKEAIERQRG